jgi:dipeptidyl aminopeptidase/acylaminoacyl peptidase
MRRFSPKPRWFLFTVLLLLASIPLIAQQKKPLTHDVYDFWNRINESAISVDGQWVMLSLGPLDGDAELRIKSLSNDRIYRVPRGVSAKFSYDSRFSVFLIKAPKDSVKKAKREKKKKEQMPKDSLGIVDLESGGVTRLARVKSFKLPEEAAGWVAIHLEKSIAKKDTTKAEENEKKKEEKAEKGKKSKKKKAEGTELVLRNLKTGAERRYPDVTSYHFSKDGKWLVYTAASKDSSADGIYAVRVETGEVRPILTGPGEYKQVAIDEAGKQVAFLSNRDDFVSPDSSRAQQPAFTLYHWRIGGEVPAAVAREGTPGIPEGWWVSEHGKVSFSKNGKRLFFGTAPRPEPEPEEDKADDEKVKVDIWNWKDPYLQPMQLKQLESERKRSYRAVVHLGKGRVVQLATEEVPEVTVGSEGNADVALGNSNMPYRQLISWDFPRYYDVYLIDVRTGKRLRVLEKVQARAQLSPKARYITWWNRDELAWYAMDVNGQKPINLTAGIPYPVHNELHDWPFKPNPYGNAGWTKDDKAFLIYDRYDIWATDPTGKRAPRNLTEGVGRADSLRFRYVRLDPEEKAIDPKAPMLLSAFHLYTKASGFYRDRVEGGREPARLVMMDRAFSTPRKAKEADRLLFTRSSFVEFPDLWMSDPDFRDMRKVSNANPQQSEYLWGTAELVEWTSLDGVPLQGILYKPENFDPGKKYPMMVYFYERNSDNLYRHWAPEPHRSIINFTFYVSRGYLVFVPDIRYKVGYPGESAVNAVLPGVTHLIKRGFVDEANIGVQGHSWGGYQVAYLVTRTNIFKAAEAGAPVSNMTSAYGGIRWGSGMSRMFQYERTQSRIGGSLWEVPLRYIENSPLFWADRIETPLLIMHNDQDGAVPWYQGIELFVALRRLGKPVWLINYNDEPHWPTKFQNKKDWAMRLQQFFDYYLKGAPAPVWLMEGVPAIRKGKTLGLEPVTTDSHGGTRNES